MFETTKTIYYEMSLIRDVMIIGNKIQVLRCI